MLSLSYICVRFSKLLLLFPLLSLMMFFFIQIKMGFLNKRYLCIQHANLQIIHNFNQNSPYGQYDTYTLLVVNGNLLSTENAYKKRCIKDFIKQFVKCYSVQTILDKTSFTRFNWNLIHKFKSDININCYKIGLAKTLIWGKKQPVSLSDVLQIYDLLISSPFINGSICFDLQNEIYIDSITE